MRLRQSCIFFGVDTANPIYYGQVLFCGYLPTGLFNIGSWLCVPCPIEYYGILRVNVLRTVD